MSQNSGPCRWLNSPGGCRFGRNCKFSHDLTSTTSPYPASSTSPPSSRSPKTVPQSPRSPAKRPNGACESLWTNGVCEYGFECRYRHVKQPRMGNGQSQAGDPTVTAHADESEAVALDIFSPEGLAASAGSVCEEQHSLDPSEVHNYLKTFLRDKYQFESATQVQAFVRILASVNDRNRSWNTDSAQEFLQVVVKGNALHRIGEVLRFEPINVSIGVHTGTLSFQRGYFPLFQFFASDFVLKSPLHKNINVLYAVIKNNHEAVFATLDRCLETMMNAKSWRDPTPNLSPSLQNTLDGMTVFRTLSTLLRQYFNRYNDGVRIFSDVPRFVKQFAEWYETWATDVSSIGPRFEDSITSVPESNRRHLIGHIRQEIHRLTAIVERETGVVMRPQQGPQRSALSPEQRAQARIGQLAQTYYPPGELRRDGPRHDNDFANIRSIRIAPTHEELFCPVNPYIPVFSPDAPHHLPAGSMERHLDIQFRLLREELLYSTRSSLAAVHDDLNKIWEGRRQKHEKTQLEELIEKHGGAYRTTGRDSIFFQVYTNVEFLANPPEAGKRGVTVTLLIDAPRTARDEDTKKRVAYWEHSKRLQGSSLVALVVVSDRGPGPRSFRVHLGVVASYNTDIAESAKLDRDRIQLRVSFFDSEVELMALRGERLCVNKSTFAVLVDNGVMFESVRPFLHKLQTAEPTDIPFSYYIAPGGSLEGVQVLQPEYALVPGFRFGLQCLAKEGTAIADLDITNEHSIERARHQLKRFSVLDPSQADAVVDTLTRRVSLIQGPPGTGKSFTAREILRVLLSSKIKPIVLIAYTNHALDHMLTSVLDAGITDKLVRLGAQSSDERISQLTLDKLERLAKAPVLDRLMKRQYATMMTLKHQMSNTMTAIRLPTLTWDNIEKYLQFHYLEHADQITRPPFWISQLVDLKWFDEEQKGEFQTVGSKKNKKNTLDASVAHTLYGFWRDGFDIDYIQQGPVADASQANQGAQRADAPPDGPQSFLTNPPAFFASLELDGLPPVPMKNRPLKQLLNDAKVWSMSLSERARLAEEWECNIRKLAYDSRVDEYNRLKAEYEGACKEYDDMRNEVRRRLLSQTDLIGCTTTGAASLTSLLSSIAPRVLMVEEAGQVLEAHILASLVESVHHLICIGDPKQLRPTLATYPLSMDSAIGNELYKFDRSLMERLSDTGYPMSQINVQRRMRPTISQFIRKILYPKLEDNELVCDYPAVQGMQKDVFFFNHLNKEDGTEDSVSKFNVFEVDMIRDLVVYFLHQELYSGPGDIAVLCAYLGQLQMVRAALRDLKIAVAIDERDAEQLARQGIDEGVEFEEVLVAKRVRLGTVDIFQGQEAKIVIVSLVRNSGQVDTGSSSIGFLQSPNRINVALSRAKHGLYVFGNAANLRQNATWSAILDEMENREQIGTAFPIICPRHPDQVNLVSKPGELSSFAPAGGCTLPCNARLACGHTCLSACHASVDNHRSVRCLQPCKRTPCPREHPCSKLCSDECGDCHFPQHHVELPCGHIADEVPCYMLEDLRAFKCEFKVRKQLPWCEHSATLACHEDPGSVWCQEWCGETLQCCQRTCKSMCANCRDLTSQQTPEVAVKGPKVVRTRHAGHQCERLLYCEHKCGLPCHSQDGQCNTSCREACRQQCVHHYCPKPCFEPCAPCMEPCPWSCAHASCPVPCGSICSRLPCDEPCGHVLKCGHPCPSVCGEPCAMQKCIVCSPADRKADIVDFIVQRRLEDIDPDSTDISDRLVTLACGHIFTVETLDGHCDMVAFYEMDEMGRFLSTKSPPIGYQKPPTCPTCRGPITALRYGRVTKRATLDILEQNVAGTMSRALEGCSLEIAEFTSSMDGSRVQARQLQVSPEEDKEHHAGKSASSFAQPNSPLPATAFDQEGMQKVQGLPLDEARAWYKVVKPIVVTYRRIAKIATTRGAHVKAYEAALSTLYRLELQEIANDPERATDAPEAQAHANVPHKIGQPKPKADVRFQVEAYILSLEIRALIAQLAQSRVEGLSVTSNDPEMIRHRRRWTAFVSFLYSSCIADAEKAAKLATESSASRQVARASVHKLRFELENFRWKVICDRTELLRSNRFDEEARANLSCRVSNYKHTMLQSADHIQKAYMRQRPLKTMDDMRTEHQWLDENCQKKVDSWQSACDALEEHILKGGFYQPMSTLEIEDIVKSFGFSHRGHFYNCENGHTFVITECGGAIETATCPECKAPIGGSDHNLLSANARATEFEAISRQNGSLDSPWAWARDA